MFKIGKTNYISEKWQLYGFVGVLALFALSLLFPTTITTVLFYVGLLVYAVLFPVKALAFLLIYFPVRAFYIEISPQLKLAGEIVIFGGLLHILWNARKDILSLFRFHWFELALFAFCAIGSISAYLSGVSIMAIITQLRAFLLMYLLYYIVKRLVVKKEDIYWYVWTAFIVASILSVFGLIEKFSDKTFLYPADWSVYAGSKTNGPRIYGLAGNPNVLASFLVLAVFTSLYLKGLLSGWKQKMVWVGIFLISTVSILTYSRGTMLAMLVAFVVYIVWKRNWKNVLRITTILAVSCALAFGVVEPLNKAYGIVNPDARDQYERLFGTFSSETLDNSINNGRLWIIKNGWTIFQDHPIAGSGFATFADSATLSYYSPIYEQYDLHKGIYSDNQYIQVLAQTGILGTIAFLLFLLGMFVVILKRRDKPFFEFTMLLFVAVVAGSLVYNAWEEKTITLFMYGLLGILCSKSELVQGESLKK